MALVDSLLNAMVRADGDALVMHVGERPIVVSGSRTVDLSNHGMNLGAMVGMLGQLLSLDAQALLRELGAVEHELPSRESDRFSVVAARSGDDIWIEIRRRREALAQARTNGAGPHLPAAEAEPDLEPAGSDSVYEEPAGEVYEEPAGEAPGPPVAIAEADDVAAPIAAGEVTESEPPTADHAAVAEQWVSSYGEADTDVEPADTDVEPAGVPEPVEAAADSEPIDADLETPDQQSQDDVDGPGEPAAVASITPVEPSAESASEPVPAEREEPEAVEPARESGDEPEPIAAAASAAADVANETPSILEAPAVPALASAAAALHPVSSLASGLPMDAARHQGHSAGGPPPESAASVTPSEPGEPGARLPEAAVTRTVRIEVPDRATASRATGIDRLLRAADALGASELFLVSQARPYVRAGGNVRPLQDEALLLAADIEALIADVTPEPWRDAVRRGDPADWLIELSDVGRVRCATFRDHRGPGANFHFSFLRAATADDLQLSAETRRLATEPDGLVIVSGAAGSEMSAVVAAFVDLLNQQRADYIITLEPQVRILHVNREALVSQREVGSDPARAAASALAALREQPDVLVIESLGSGELAQLAIDAATQNRLVIVSIEAPSAAAAVQRLVELVPADHRAHARHQLARSFRGAVAQLVLRKSAGGKIAARELLTTTRAVTDLLADAELPHLASRLESAVATGLAPIADTVVDYVRSGLVDVREAVRKSPDPARLLDRLRAAGEDLSALDGWS